MIPVLHSKQVILIRSTPTYLRCIADQARSKYDQPTLYRRPPRCIPAQHTTYGERDHPRPFFNRLKNLSRSSRPRRAGPTNPRFGTCMCSNVETNLSWTCLVSGPLNFEHPSVLLFCLRPTHALLDQGPLIADPLIFPERERPGVDRVSGVNGPLSNTLFSKSIWAQDNFTKIIEIFFQDLLRPSYLSSLSAGRSKAGPIRMSLNIFLIYTIY